MTTAEVIRRFRVTHGKTYDYSRVVYRSAHANIIIICRKHGPFKQSPNNHVRGRGCPNSDCSSSPRLETQQRSFEGSRSHTGDSFGYEKVRYRGIQKNVTVICRVPGHGPFEVTPDNHMRGHGCPVCRYITIGNKKRLSQAKVIKRFHAAHGDLYDYSRVEYVKSEQSVTIICKIHGPFEQTPSLHWSGYGSKSV